MIAVAALKIHEIGAAPAAPDSESVFDQKYILY